MSTQKRRSTESSQLMKRAARLIMTAARALQRALYALTLAAIFHPASIAASPLPSAFCGVYSTLNSAKLRVTFSVRRSSPPLPPVETDVTRTSFMVILRYSSAVSPALRTVNTPSSKCLPLQHAITSVGEPLSTYLVIDKSCTLTLPAPPPLPTCVVPD